MIQKALFYGEKGQFYANFLKKKILTRADPYNIITQCDDVEKCLTKAPERHFDINNMWKTPIPRVST